MRFNANISPVNNFYYLHINGFIKTIVVGLCLVVICLSPNKSIAKIKPEHKYKLEIPDSNYVQILSTRDGSTNIGRITHIRESEIEFKTDFGKITIPISKIKDIKIVASSSIKNGRYWFPNPNATRLYFSPTARMLGQGEGYFSDYYVFFPGVSYGVTNNITIGGGMSLFPGGGVNKQIYYLTPKVGIKASKHLSCAVGTLLIKLPAIFDNDSHKAGVLYGVSTYGTPDKNLTFGFGYGFVDGTFAEKPMLLIGGEKRLSRRIAFVSENWIFPGVDHPLISYGLRFFGESLSIDLAFLNVWGDDSAYTTVPYMDFVFKF